MFTNQLDAAEARLQVGERYLQSLQGEETIQQRAIRGNLEIMRANLARLYVMQFWKNQTAWPLWRR